MALFLVGAFRIGGSAELDGMFTDLLTGPMGFNFTLVAKGGKRDCLIATVKGDKFLSESSIYALTSDIEGFPNALCEAMAHGLACISFDCVAGPGDIIRHGENGILIEEGDTDRFVSELDRLIQDKDLRMRLGREAEKIQITLHGDRIFSRYLDFILDRAPLSPENKQKLT